MNYAPLDPSTTVVLFADLQEGIIELAATNEAPRLRRAVAALAKLARLFDIPVIVTTAPSQTGAIRIIPEIAAALGELPPNTRTTTDAFLHAPTRDAIAQTARQTLLIAGVATEIIVQHSALSAAARGLQMCIGYRGRMQIHVIPAVATRCDHCDPARGRLAVLDLVILVEHRIHLGLRQAEDLEIALEEHVRQGVEPFGARIIVVIVGWVEVAEHEALGRRTARGRQEPRREGNDRCEAPARTADCAVLVVASSGAASHAPILARRGSPE